MNEFQSIDEKLHEFAKKHNAKLLPREIGFDTNFIRLANITYDFGQFIKGVIDEQQLNLDTVQAQMQLISSSATRQEQLVEINDIFTVDVSTELEAYITEFADKFETLTTEYGDIFL